jgi:hypothetical protein
LDENCITILKVRKIKGAWEMISLGGFVRALCILRLKGDFGGSTSH